MATGQRDAILDPAIGLMIFNSTTNAFNYWNGTAWIAIAAGNIKELSDADNDTKVQVEKTPDEDKVNIMVAGATKIIIDNKSMQMFSPTNSIYIGEDAGISSNGSETSNTVVGSFAGGALTSGSQKMW
jgi:hypothetical protein